MPVSQNIDARMQEDSAWWAVYTRHQHEKVVAGMLSAKGFEVFLPLYESTRRWKDRSKVLLLPLFPCYLFLRGEHHRRLQAVTTPGVHMILCNSEHVATVPEAEIQAIRKTVEGSFRVEPHPFLKCGERVRVKRGTLEGVEGILIRKKNQYRLVLSVEYYRSPWEWKLTLRMWNLSQRKGWRAYPRPGNLPALETYQVGSLNGRRHGTDVWEAPARFG